MYASTNECVKSLKCLNRIYMFIFYCFYKREIM